MTFAPASPSGAYGISNRRANAGQRVGASFFHDAAVAANTVTAIVTAGTNTTGIILRTVAFVANSTTGTMRFYADTVAPSALSDTARKLVGTYVPSQQILTGIAPGLVIPPGNGFWVVHDHTGAVVALTWDAI